MIMQELPLAVSAKMEFSQTSDLDVEELADLILIFRSAEAHVHFTWRALSRQNYGTVEGDWGKLFINDDHLVLCTNGSPPVRYDFPGPLSRGSHHPEWMQHVVENFRQEILDVNIRGSNLKESTWCAYLIQLAYQSHRARSCFIPVDDLIM
jgi:hypothetical protein